MIYYIVRGLPCVTACNEKKLKALQIKSKFLNLYCKYEIKQLFFELVSICVLWDLKHADNELHSG